MQSISLYPDDSPRPPAPITLAEQIAAVQRELARAAWSQQHADYHLSVIHAVLMTLLRLKDAQASSLREVSP